MDRGSRKFCSPRPELAAEARLLEPAERHQRERRVARCALETRTIPIPPGLVRLLRTHLRRYGATPDGRIFQTARGGIIQDSAYSAVWAGRRQEERPHRSTSPAAARPAFLPPAPRRGLAVAQLRGACHRGRPLRRARRPRPAQDLRALDRRAGRGRQPAQHRRPSTPPMPSPAPETRETTTVCRHSKMQGQGQETGQDGQHDRSHPRRPWPSVRRTASGTLGPRTHSGRRRPRIRLGTHKSRSAAYDSGGGGGLTKK